MLNKELGKAILQVVVGNLGTIYTGTDEEYAVKEYETYVKLSKENYGRIAGESVVILADGELYMEYEGTHQAE